MKEVEFLNCPLCSRSRVLTGKHALKPGKFPINPKDFYVYSVREQVGGSPGGRARPGFFNLDGREKTILELYLSDNLEHKQLAEILKGRVVELVRAWLEIGILKREELE